MTEDELLKSLLARRADEARRIDVDTVPVPHTYATATDSALDEAERRIGCALPGLLKNIYRRVGNGGFGPGFGLIGVGGGYPDSEGRTLAERYEALLLDGWPVDLLPMCDWGDGSWSCIERRDEGRIVTMDEFGRTPTRFSLAQFLEEWVRGTDLHGELYEVETATITNPFTRKAMTVKRRARPRGA